MQVPARGMRSCAPVAVGLQARIREHLEEVGAAVGCGFELCALPELPPPCCWLACPEAHAPRRGVAAVRQHAQRIGQRAQVGAHLTSHRAKNVRGGVRQRLPSLGAPPIVPSGPQRERMQDSAGRPSTQPAMAAGVLSTERSEGAAAAILRPDRGAGKAAAGIGEGCLSLGRKRAPSKPYGS